jgi:CHAT domain-containing protein
LVPIHAAGIYDVAGRECCSDYFVSSYTPTLPALLRAQRSADQYPTEASNLAIISAATPHVTCLPFLRSVEEETHIVVNASGRARVPVHTCITNTSATVDSVSDSLEDAHLAHIACHFFQDPNDILSSGFVLSDGILSLSRLMELDLKHAFFAFVSACETAKGDARQSGEAVHLAATMLFVGFRSVVATLWLEVAP